MKPQLLEGSGGIFDVKLNDEMVFSKLAEGDRFPEHDEVIALLRARW